MKDRNEKGQFVKKNTPWNKGLTKKEDSRVALLGTKNRKGICFNTGRTHIQPGQHLSSSTELQKGGNPWNKGFLSVKVSKELLYKLYHVEGLSTYDIARKYGVSANTITRMMDKLGVPLRTRAVRAKINWENVDYAMTVRSKSLSSLMQSPTVPEQKVIEVIEINNYPFRYTGNGSHFIGVLNPDFIATNGTQKLIEVFGRVFHDPTVTFKEEIPEKSTEKGRIQYFKDHGWDALILWDDHILNSSFDLSARIGEFIDD